ncbi:MAG: hypothetical protein AAB824_01755 [Patescibacteria group bacterium]
MLKKLTLAVLLSLSAVLIGYVVDESEAAKKNRPSLHKEIKLFRPSTISKINELGAASFKSSDKDDANRIITVGSASFVPLNVLGRADESNITPLMVLNAVSFFEKENPNLEIVNFNPSAGPFLDCGSSNHWTYVWGVWVYHKPKVKTS